MEIFKFDVLGVFFRTSLKNDLHPDKIALFEINSLHSIYRKQIKKR